MRNFAGLRAAAPLLSAALLLTGCRAVPLTAQPFDRRGPELPAQSVFAVDWQVKLVGPQLWESFPRESAAPAVDPDTGRIITLTRDGYVRSINPDGGVEWDFKTRGLFVAGAAIVDGIVYVPGGDGTLYALRSRNGEQVWAYESGEALATTPVVSGNQVFVQSEGNTLFAVNRENGQWAWQHRRDQPAGFAVHGVAQPTLEMGVLYAGFSDGFLVALEPETGAVRWERALGTTGNEFLDVDTRPSADERGRLFAASYRGGMFGIDATSGNVMWNSPANGITSLLQRGDVLYTGGDGELFAWLGDNGRQLWRLRIADHAAGRPVFVDGMLLVPVHDALMFVDPATGLRRMAWDPGQGVTAPPTPAGQRIYVLSNLGYLYALRLTGSGG